MRPSSDSVSWSEARPPLNETGPSGPVFCLECHLLKVATERASFADIAHTAGSRCGVEVELVDSADWWRADLVLVEPASGAFLSIEARPELWAPAVIGIGACPTPQARLWSWAWIPSGDSSAEALSWYLPRAQRRGSLRRDLRRSLAHDLRSPLGVVSGYCELLGEELLGSLQPKQQRAVTTIADQSERLLSGLELLAARLMAPGDAPR